MTSVSSLAEKVAARQQASAKRGGCGREGAKKVGKGAYPQFRRILPQNDETEVDGREEQLNPGVAGGRGMVYTGCSWPPEMGQIAILLGQEVTRGDDGII